MGRVIVNNGTEAACLTYKGLLGEIVYDTDNKSLRVYDGESPGGFIINPSFISKTYDKLNSIDASIRDVKTIIADSEKSFAESITELSSSFENNLAYEIKKLRVETTANYALASSFELLKAQYQTNFNNVSQDVVAALTSTDEVDSLSDGKIVIFFAAENAPTTGMSVGDIWIRTDDNNKSYRYFDNIWSVDEDKRIATGILAIVTSTDIALGKITAFVSTIAPSIGMVDRDIWFDIDDNYKMYRYSGASWQAIGRIATTEALISNEQIARANADSALASSINTVSSTVNGHTTTITQHTESINGMSGKWGVTIDGGGTITGIQLIGGLGSVGSFIINADVIINGTLTTGKIADNAVTGMVGVFTAAMVYVSPHTVQQLYISTTGRPVLIHYTFTVSVNLGPTSFIRARWILYRDGVIIIDKYDNAWGNPGYVGEVTISGSFVDYPGAGTHHYWIDTDFYSTLNASMAAIELKK